MKHLLKSIHLNNNIGYTVHVFQDVFTQVKPIRDLFGCAREKIRYHLVRLAFIKKNKSKFSNNFG